MTAAPDQWQALRRELDAWQAAGATARLWWRDDDAIAPTAALDRMLALVDRHHIPLGLAVIPAAATAALVDRLAGEALVDVLQHGFAHRNHAAAGERAAEFGAQRPLAVRLEEAGRGWHLLAPFARRVAMFVPPWNRYDPAIRSGLRDIGLAAVSTFGTSLRLPAPLAECNCHVDIISWRTTRGFAGTDKTLTKLIAELAARRTGATRSTEAIGLLTHHLAHDEGCWTFLAELFAMLAAHPTPQPMPKARQSTVPMWSTRWCRASTSCTLRR